MNWEEALEKRRYDLLDFDELIMLVPGYDPHRDAGDCVFDCQAAIEVIAFFCEILTHVKGKWAKYNFKLERWQMGILANLFGWKKPDGFRRYRETFIFVPRKNGKSTLSAGIPCFVFFTDKEPGKEIYVAAGDKLQAGIVFEISKQMIKQEWLLNSRCKILKDVISREEEMSFYRPVSKIAKTKHGYNASAIIVDELHAVEDAELIEALETSMGSRDEPILILITTADFERESICNDKHKYAQDVRDGTIPDPSFLPVLYEADGEEDWTDEEVWKRVNPNIGISPTWEYMRAKAFKAKADPAFENTFKRLHLNMRTQQDIRCWPLERWDACDGVDLVEADLIGCECYAGLDLASTEDVAALVLYFPNECAVLPYFWTPSDVAERRERKSRGKYLTWSRQGHMFLCDGEVINHREIFHFIVDELSERFRIQEIAYDRWNAHQIIMDLQQDGVEVAPCGQGYASLSAPMKFTWDLIRSKKLQHGANPVLRWMVGNLSAEEDAAGNIKPSKKTSYEKIDGVVALIMAIGCSALDETEENVYSERGFLSL